LATPKQRDFLVKYLGYEKEEAGLIDFERAKQLIQEKIDVWRSQKIGLDFFFGWDEDY